MEKWVVYLLVVLAVSSPKASGKDSPLSIVSIDCGASSSDLGWWEDGEFTKTGENKLISISNVTKEMSTLRFFPNGKKNNCYKIPIVNPNKYHVRAGFLYGNYDGISRAPSFDMQLNGKLWATVSTSLSEEPIYYEGIYPTIEDMLSVCLVRNGDGGIPFISSLQIQALYYDFYTSMTNNTLFSLESRVHFIRDQDSRQWTKSIYEDRYNRIWKTMYVPNYVNITSEYNNGLWFDVENKPPEDVLAGAIEAQSISDSIYLTIDIPLKTQISAYMVLYFREPAQYRIDPGIRKIKIIINGREMAITEVLHNRSCRVITLYPVVVASPVNVTIAPVEGSTSPPIINGLEIYAANNLELSKGGRLQYHNSPLFLIFFYVFGGGFVVSWLI